MATVTLVANTNYSALTVASGDTIALAGFQLTLDVAPSQTNVTVDATGNAGTMALGTPTTYALTGWALKAGTVALLTLGTKTVSGFTATGGSAANAAGVSISGTPTVSNCAFVGGTNATAYGLLNTGGNAVTLTGCTFTGSAAAHGFNFSLPTVLAGCTATGGSASGVHGVNVMSGSLYVKNDCTANGGSASGAHGILLSSTTSQQHLVDAPTLASATSGAYAVSVAATAATAPCTLVLDVRKMTGVCVNRGTAMANVLLYGGTSTANLSGSSGTIRMIPQPSDVRSGTGVMGEAGTLSAGNAAESWDGGVDG